MSKPPLKQPFSRKWFGFAAIGAFALGLFIGLPVLGWWLWPVQWTSTPQPPRPTYTLYPTYTPYPTYTRVPTSTPVPPTSTPTPGPDGNVLVPNLTVLQGPGPGYPVVGQIGQAEQLRVIGQYANCGWLQVETSNQLAGWVSSENGSVQLQKPCTAIPHGIFRPLSGMLKSPTTTGQGQLSVENGTAADGVVILAGLGSSSESVAAAYVRASETYILDGIPNGTYNLYFATGSDWDGESSRFTKSGRMRRFKDSFDYTTSSLTYTTWKVTLQPVVGGTAQADDVPSSEFPAIK